MAKVLVPLADGCEELEAVTVIDLLRRAGIDVTTAGLKPGIVQASRGVQLVPDVTNLKDDARILELLKKMAADGRYTAAICAAPMVLAEAGVLDGKQATSYPGFLDALPGVTVSAAAVVQDGKVLTSRGPGTAMDFALALVEALAGAEKRQQVEAALVRS
jgi:4-methyl-5(b-hydroxyethyl)-thiazole monophosphate biosynthesis